MLDCGLTASPSAIALEKIEYNKYVNIKTDKSQVSKINI